MMPGQDRLTCPSGEPFTLLLGWSSASSWPHCLPAKGVVCQPDQVAQYALLHAAVPGQR
jgi:hypothetical protein